MIPLGFELETGRAVDIPLRHLAVTGQTMDAGKTTTLEALISRSGLRAVCFVTKPGEKSFSKHRTLTPYFRESAGWRFVEAILEAAMREAMDYKRSWIMKLCSSHHGRDGFPPAGLAARLAEGEDYFDLMEITAKGRKRAKVKDFSWPRPKTLAEVAQNVEIALLKARGLHEGVYTELREYLAIVIPQIRDLPKTSTLNLEPGVNVMRLEKYSVEMQGLIIRSVLEWIMEHEKRTVTVIPEAWKMIPQARSSPVLLACEELIRQGGANQNFIWLDSQDIAGVHKAILRQVAVWILGVQREVHEAERTLDHLPGARRPQIDEIRTLGKGQFFVAWGTELRKVYVQPAWMSADMACAVAMTGRQLS